MHFVAAADTDVGTVKETNQDSVCVKIAETPHGQIAMAVVGDGMGGLQKGELASAAAINAFAKWFDTELLEHMDGFDWDFIAGKWTHMLKRLNKAICEYGKDYDILLGTTLTAMLLFGDEYLIAHVGDSRAYEAGTELIQLTDDHSVVGREVRQGLLTEEEAELDSRRNILLQCVGASKTVTPQIVKGKLKDGANYLLCSDGFRHAVSKNELFSLTAPKRVNTAEAMQTSLRKIINTVKDRGEQDNISALLVNARL